MKLLPNSFPSFGVLEFYFDFIDLKRFSKYKRCENGYR